MRTAGACLLAAVAAAAVYWGTLGHGFVWDDHIHIERSPFVLDTANAKKLLSSDFWTGRLPVDDGARPVVLATLLADRAAWGGDPAGYHLTNVLLHAAAAASLAALAAAVTASPAAGALAGLLFALHPVQSEAVCGVTFRADVLAALFVLLALLARRRAARGRTAAWTAASAAAFALALLSKESAVVMPVWAWFEERLVPAGPRSARREAVQLAAFALVLGAYAAFRVPRGVYDVMNARSPAPASALSADAPAAASEHLDPSPQPWTEELRDPGARARTMLGVFLDYARLTAWPSGLQADRSAPVVRSWSSPRAWGGLAAALALLAAAWLLRRRLPAASLGLTWFFAALAPVSGVIALYNLSAERYLYLPLAGAALGAAAVLEAASRRAERPSLVLAAASVAVLAPAAVATARRIPAWRDDAALFGGGLATDGARLRYNRGLLAQQDARLDDAAAEYRLALGFNPNYVEALVNLSEIEGLQGRKDEELDLLRRAAALNPPSALAREALGQAYQRRGRQSEALRAFKEAAGVDGRLPSARRLYAAALARAGRWDEAAAQAAAAARLEPRSAAPQYELGRIAQEQGRWTEAARAFRKAVAADPADALSWANLGACLHRAGDPKGALGPMKEAEKLLPGSAEARRNLGALYDDLGDDARAETEYAAAVRLDPGSALAWHGYGVVLQKSGRPVEAEDAYAKALRADPAKAESLANLAQLSQADVEAGREPRSAEAWYALGIAAQNSGALARAVEDFRGAVRADPRFGLAWANLGVCLHHSGKLEDALEPMRTAARLLPKRAEPRRNLGALLDDLGRSEEAVAQYAAAVRLDPDSALGWHGYAVVLQKRGRAAEAEAAYARALKAEPAKVESLVNLALMRAQDGDLDQARALIARALAARPGDEVALRAQRSIAAPPPARSSRMRAP